VTPHPSVIAIIQARMGSSRLPGKALRTLGERPVLDWVVRAARTAGVAGNVVVATSENARDDPIEKACARLGVACVRGPEEDVLSRFLLALQAHPAEVVIRLTADCPLLDPTLIAHATRAFLANEELDYLSTVLVRSLPRGLDVEVASARALRQLAEHATGHDRVHVTSGLYTDSGRFRVAGLTFLPRAEDLRVTLDTPEDAELLGALVAELGDRPPSWRRVVGLLRERGDLVAINADVRQKPLEVG
jgi:spore coat polysaccharide biosynthesis protein SpsF